MSSPKSRAFRERRSAKILSVTQRALRPLVKLLLLRGIGFPVFSEALRSVFFQVARDEFPLHHRRQTDSRLSLLTGIHRRDIKRLRDQASAASSGPVAKGHRNTPAETGISLSARVVALWTGTRAYLDRQGKPIPLQRFERKGGGHSFEALVREVNRDVRPRALLDEWLRRGAVTLDDEDRVRLNLDAFMSHKDIDEKAFYLAQNIHDHLATVVHNITDGETPHLERCVYYGALTRESVEELENLARQEGMKALQAVNRRALQLKKQDAGKKNADQRMNFGLYFHRASQEAPMERDRPVEDGNE